MTIITGGFKDYYVENDWRLEKMFVMPDDRVDEKKLMKRLLEEADPKIATGLLLLLLDYNKSDVAFILGMSDSWIYSSLIPKIKLIYKEINEDGSSR